jgi:hypothetical protein
MACAELVRHRLLVDPLWMKIPNTGGFNHPKVYFLSVIA